MKVISSSTRHDKEHGDISIFANVISVSLVKFPLRLYHRDWNMDQIKYSACHIYRVEYS